MRKPTSNNQTESSAFEPDPGKSRRDFLKIATGAGVALASGLTTANTHSSTPFTKLPAGFIYLNSGTEGSMPQSVLTTFTEALDQWASNPTTSYELDPVLGKRQQLNRSKVARFLGVSTNNICLTDNTTMGCSMTLTGLNFQPGDKVVIFTLPKTIPAVEKLLMVKPEFF